MSWTNRDTGVSFLSIAAGATLGILVWKYVAPDHELLPTAQDPVDQAAFDDLVDLQTQNQKLLDEVRDLQTALSRQIEEEPKAPPSETVDAPDRLKAALAGSLLLTDEQYAEVLAKIDWATMGGSMKDMVPLIEQLAEALAAGEDPDLAIQGQIQKLNGDLLTIAQVIMEGEVPGTGVNGSFTHPLVAGNQIAAALTAAGLGLDDGQIEGLENIMRVYAARDRGLRDTESSESFKLTNLLEEIDLKSEFYSEARAMLSPEQSAALYRDGSAGRIGMDMFDAGLMLGEYAKPVGAASSTEFAGAVAKRFGSLTNLSDDARQQLDNVVATWANRHYGDAFWSESSDPLSKRGMMTSSQVRVAMRNQVTLMREIFSQVKLSAADRAKLMSNLGTIVPLVK